MEPISKIPTQPAFINTRGWTLHRSMSIVQLDAIGEKILKKAKIKLSNNDFNIWLKWRFSINFDPIFNY